MTPASSDRITKRAFLRLAVLGAAASVVAACGPAATPANTPVAPATAKPADTAKPAATTQPAAQAAPGKQGGTFTYAEAGDFNSNYLHLREREPALQEFGA